MLNDFEVGIFSHWGSFIQ